MIRIIDTSVVVKWAVVEDQSSMALKLVGTDIVAPDLLKAELANALWKKARRGEISTMQAAAAFAEVSSLLEYLPVARLADRALDIALELSHAVYDCFFLALAEAMDTQLITSDAKLERNCAGTAWAQRITILADA